MSDLQDDTYERPAFSDALVTVTRRGKLMPARRGGVLELETDEERVELLGPFASSARVGDEVEVVGIPAPEPHDRPSEPGMLVREVRVL
ncbi:hypothetical protein [Phytoactinopolyspora mesophila]|uniref:Uncharacterized protein n=1 Tax=Phytoactinopolyspora mesophila TaxID=2650750 RepID=A0A7K3M4F7_9ACTN|nr:hypothetical protein [Phytoactinopolyspora mesophila]NDL58194.1 hypothetical protein [Phytoactinopolyspora mesophila]